MSWSDGAIEEGLEQPEVREVLDTGRSAKIEFYVDVPEDESKLVKEACGIGNRDGGVILFGVDKNGTIQGIDNYDDSFDDIAEIFEELIEVDFEYYLDYSEFDGEIIIVCRIKPYTETDAGIPYAVDGQFFRRKSRRSYTISPSTLQEWMTSS